MRRLPLIAVILAATALYVGAATIDTKDTKDNNIIRLTSLDWPPYTDSNVPNSVSEKVARDAFKAMGYTLVVQFLPWNRAVYDARHDPQYVGYFPEYFSETIAQDFLYSQPIGTGPLGFAERKSDPLTWSSLDDLKSVTIGTVLGYVNTEDLDARIRDGRIKSDAAPSDQINLKKLLAGRVKAIVIDRNVMTYLLQNDPDLAAGQTKLQFNDRILEDKPLFICFRKDDKGREMLRIFNEGLEKIRATGGTEKNPGK